MTPFVSVFISYTFLSWDSPAEELEDPFGTSANDLPLNAMCNTIERNLMDMTGQHPLPEKNAARPLLQPYMKKTPGGSARPALSISECAFPAAVINSLKKVATTPSASTLAPR